MFDPIRQLPEREEEPEKGFLETFVPSVIGSYRRQSIWEGTIGEQYPEVEGYDAFDPEQEDLAGYDPMDFVGSRSPEETMSIMDRIDQEREWMQAEQENFVGSMVGVIGGVATNPLMYIGGLAALPRGVGALVATEMGVELATEAVLQSQQYERTLGESAMNVAMVGAASAVLGKFADRLTARQKQEIAQYTEERWLQDMRDNNVPGYVVDDISGRSAGAMQADSFTLDEQRLIGGKVIGAIAQGPLQRLLQVDAPGVRTMAQKIADSAFYTRMMKKGKTVGENVEILTARARGLDWAGTVNNLNQWRKYASRTGQRRYFNRKSYEEFDNEVGKALSNADRHEILEVAEAASWYRENVLEPYLRSAQDLNMLPKDRTWYQREIDRLRAEGKPNQQLISRYIEDMRTAPTSMAKYANSYFPRVYKRQAILDNYSALRARLTTMVMDTSGIEDIAEDEANRIAGDIVHNMMGGSPLEEIIDFMPSISNRPNSTKERVVALTDKELEPYRETRASVVLSNYINGYTPYIEANRIFGEGGMRDLLQRANDEYDALINAAPDAKERSRLLKQKDRARADLEGLINRAMNLTRASKDPSGLVSRSIRTVLGYNMVTQLGGILLSSLPDIARPIFQYGFAQWSKTIGSLAVKSILGNFKGSKAQLSRMGVATERILSRRGIEMASMQDEPEGRVMSMLTNAWQKTSLFDVWTDTMESIAGMAAQDRILRLARNLSEGKRVSTSDKMKLARMGLDEDTLRAIANERSHWTGGTLLEANTLEWGRKDLARRFESAVLSDTQHMIIRRRHGDQPLMMDNEWVKLIYQYMTFPFGATNRMLVNGLQMHDIKQVQGLLMMVSLGALVGGIKGHLRGEDIANWEDEKWLMEGIDRSGILGVYNVGLNVLRWSLGDIPTKYLERSVEFGGPTVSQGANLVKLVDAIAEGDEEKIKEHGFRALPIVNNSLHIRQILEKMAE